MQLPSGSITQQQRTQQSMYTKLIARLEQHAATSLGQAEKGKQLCAAAWLFWMASYYQQAEAGALY